MVMTYKGEIFNQLDMSLEAVLDDLIAKSELDGSDASKKTRRLLIRLAALALFRAAWTYGVTVEEADELARGCLTDIMKDNWRARAKIATNTSLLPN